MSQLQFLNHILQRHHPSQPLDTVRPRPSSRFESQVPLGLSPVQQPPAGDDSGTVSRESYEQAPDQESFEDNSPNPLNRTNWANRSYKTYKTYSSHPPTGNSGSRLEDSAIVEEPLQTTSLPEPVIQKSPPTGYLSQLQPGQITQPRQDAQKYHIEHTSQSPVESHAGNNPLDIQFHDRLESIPLTYHRHSHDAHPPHGVLSSHEPEIPRISPDSPSDALHSHSGPSADWQTRPFSASETLSVQDIKQNPATGMTGVLLEASLPIGPIMPAASSSSIQSSDRMPSSAPAVRSKTESVVNVTIGRVEVRASTPNKKELPQRHTKPSGIISLDRYLSIRSQRSQLAGDGGLS